MINSMDQYSHPIKIEKTELAIKYTLNPRRTRPGRELVVIYDQRFPFMKFDLKYSYIVRFFEERNAAGNHYHQKKEELFVPLEGKFEIHLEDIISKKRDIIKLDAIQNIALYIRTGIAHKVVSLKTQGILLVMASNPSTDGDEIEYLLN